ncbi:DEAD/DEAH box helicase [Candidatus Gracilibacteria bacterium 28_42_T64]|nr:DEAD/DEAH box helicase [Candidatus Gracilibacteria bacterium 28_42_T64]
MLFSDLDIIKPILNALDKQGYKNPTPIQERAIPHILDGKDVLGSAQTGTGKTAAFAIPILQLLSREKEISNFSGAIKCLILTPTRELAIQIEENIKEYGAQLGLRHSVIFGGVSQGSQVRKLKAGVDILVATPGRLLDLMNQGYVDLKKVEIFTLDEADRMLNMGFINDVKKVLAKLPTKRQTLFFSATMPKEIAGLADSILNHPVKIEVTPVSSTADTVKQVVFFVTKGSKKLLLIDILEYKGIKSLLVFTRTKHGADNVVKDLVKSGVTAEAIHGNKSQNARQRALKNFKGGVTRVLVATDIAARGIDIDDLTFMVNYDLSNEPETYVHRIGRTGRAGKNGVAYSFCCQEEVEYLLDIQKMLGKKIPVNEKHPYAITVDESIKAPKRQQGGRGRGGRGGGNSSRHGNSSKGKRPAVAKRKNNVKRNRNKI